MTVICLADGSLVHASPVIQENNTFEEQHRGRHPGYCTRFMNLIRITENTSRTLLCVRFFSYLIRFVLNSTSYTALNGTIAIGMNFRGSEKSGVARFFWNLQRIITMTSPKKGGET